MAKKNKGFFSRLFSSPEEESENYTDDEQEIIDNFLEDYGIDSRDLVDIALAIKQPKNYALDVLNMDVDDYLEFKKWKNSSLTERIKSCFSKVTNMTQFVALQYALKDEEHKFGDPSIKNEQWKYTEASVHMADAKRSLDFLVEKNLVDAPTIARICVRMYYALFVSIFNVSKRAYVIAQEELKNAKPLQIEEATVVTEPVTVTQPPLELQG